MTESSFPPIVITMGDPSGVGAEVTVKALADLAPDERGRYLVIGDRAVMERARTVCGLDVAIRAHDDANANGAVRVLSVPVDGLPESFGELSPRCGEASFRYIETAVDLVKDGRASCIVTAPINKAALNAAGHHYDGHTGMLAAMTGCRSSWMLLASERMNVIHVSTHISLRGALDGVTVERVAETIRTGHAHLRRMGLEAPRIAVAGINPHCGEDGLFGNEDDDIVGPAIARARSEGVDVQGPVPADTVYYRAFQGEFDLVVAQYHDQGHIPIKLIAFDTAVNVSLGLPIDRCSVDHGTAFDIAGTGKANHANMMAALDYGGRLARSRA